MYYSLTRVMPWVHNRGGVDGEVIIVAVNDQIQASILHGQTHS